MREQPNRRMTISHNDFPVTLSIGIMAWNEETSIGPMLASLFQQSVFAQLAARRERCEVICLANGCTDRTVAIAEEICARVEREHPARPGLSARVADIRQPGRNHAWNCFVHEFSAREAKFISLMDADIIFNRPDTVQRVLAELERNPRLGGASDWPCKNIVGKSRHSMRERLSLATSDMTGEIAGRLNGMMYCLRADIARNIYLPRDLGATDDGFFKTIICTDFLCAPLDTTKVVSVPGATHLYEPYLSFRDVLNNQKRQMIGQTTLYVIFEHLRALPETERAHLAATMREHEARDPDWLKKLIDAHVARVRYFWRLFPGLLAFRWRRLGQLRGFRRVTHFPAAAAGFFITLIASWQAARFLRRGIVPFWPKTVRQPVLAVPVGAE
jgi:glycosyltransferase involved in cell wall biosynthesis